MAKEGTGGTGVGAGGGVHNPSNRLPAGMSTNPESFLIISDLKAIQAHLGFASACKYAALMCCLYLPSSSR